MITHFLGDQEVTAYARDLASRLAIFSRSEDSEQRFPTVWCPIGKSGDKILRVVAAELEKLDAELSQRVSIVELFYNKSDRQINLGADCSAADLVGADVLLLDSSIHSGNSMLQAARYVLKQGCAQVITYSLTVKKSSSFLPHFFGVVVGDHDRVLFQLDLIPNNRLFSRKYQPLGLFRRINANDALNPTPSLDTGVPSIDKISLGDLYYEHRANGFDVVLVEDKGRIAGFLKIKAEPHKQLKIDVIANDQHYRGKGVGGALMRYAETMGRASCCTHIELWAIEEQVEFYERFGYTVASQEKLNAGGGETYVLMKKPLLYHFDINNDDQY